MWRKCAGATLLEFAVVASILGVVSFLLLDRLAYYQERAEKANMEYVATALKSALLVEFSMLMVEGRMREGTTLLRRNPMDWLDRKPANYIGEFDGDAPRAQSGGVWYFNRSARELVYRVKLGRHFMPDSRGEREVRFRVKANYDGEANKAQEGASPMLPSGVKLTTVEAYKWF